MTKPSPGIPVETGAEQQESAPVGLRIRKLSKTFKRRNGEIVRAVDDVSLDVIDGEFLVLLGPSGCGKTTLLRLIAGLEQPNSGSISIGQTLVHDSSRGISLAPEMRPAGMMFQSYALWPHMTAFDNVAYPLRSKGTRKDEIRPRVERVLELVGVGGVTDQYPAHMSGGQQQRVALARAIVAGDKTILFDEPLSNVDAKVRDHLRVELLAMQRELHFTAIYVTHDQEEAMTLGTRIAVLQAGKIAQVGSPREVYEEPSSQYVANFVGTADEIDGFVVSVDSDGLVIVDSEVGQLRVQTNQAPAPKSRQVLVVRPESWRISEDAESRSGNVGIKGVVESVLFLGGSRIEYVVRTKTQRLRVWDFTERTLAEGQAVSLSIDPSDIRLFSPSGT